MEDTSLGQQEICVLCGTSFPTAEGQLVSEGTACASCAAQRGAQKSTGLLPVAWIALLLALVPVCFGYVTIRETSSTSASTTTVTRVLVFSSSETQSFSSTIEGAEPAAVVRTHSDPIALVFGGAAVLAALWALVQSGRAKRSRSLVASAAALGLGALALLRGLG